ncbi:MAG: family 20 glycosylhydrolase [Kiritimatiellae bacterium]|nr:family 20 glycosylhydrolase [Kiritimatiellia bacterium]
MKRTVFCFAAVLAAWCLRGGDSGAFIPESWKMRAFCVDAPMPEEVSRFCGFVTNTLAPAGVNTLVLSVHYRYRFEKHKMCTGRNELTREDAHRIKSACDAAGVKLVPKMNLLGHQETAWTQGLFTGYPELEEFRPDGSRRFDYSHSICPSHPNAQRIVFDLMDEVVDAFGADTMHCGCDEVFEIGQCHRCRGKSPAKLYADWVNGLARHLKSKCVRTMIWSDRLINAAENGYGVWEASDNGTDKALPLMDKDILCCDWHYTVCTNGYPSVDAFAKAGMDMAVCVWHQEDGTRAFVDYAKAHDKGHVKGVVFTTWMVARHVMDALEGRDVPERGSVSGLKAALSRNFRQVFPRARCDWRVYSGNELPLEGACPGGATRYDRLPEEGIDHVPADVRQLSTHTAGMCFRFKTDSDRLRIWWKPRHPGMDMWHMPSTGASGVDVYQWSAARGWQFVAPPWPAPPKPEGAAYAWTIEPNAPTMVYLPLYNGVDDITFGVRPGADVTPLPPRASGVAKPVVFYGTSTTQGGCVSRPGSCWTAVATRLADVPCVNLGFSGAGRMEDVMLDRVAALDASAYVLDTIGNMPPALIDARYEKFVRGLREKRPETPIVLTANGWLFRDDPRERARRIKAIYAKLKTEDPAKWRNLHFVGDYGADVAPDAEGTMDGVHLNDLGSARFGKIVGEKLKAVLAK